MNSFLISHVVFTISYDNLLEYKNDIAYQYIHVPTCIPYPFIIQFSDVLPRFWHLETLRIRCPVWHETELTLTLTRDPFTRSLNGVLRNLNLIGYQNHWLLWIFYDLFTISTKPELQPVSLFVFQNREFNMRKPPPSVVTKWLPLLLLSHLSHGKLIQWTINEEMEPGTKIIIDLPQELGLDRRPEGYTFKVTSL